MFGIIFISFYPFYDFKDKLTSLSACHGQSLCTDQRGASAQAADGHGGQDEHAADLLLGTWPAGS